MGHRRRQPATDRRPLYAAYGLYYNKAKFAAAGIGRATTTWTEFVADAKKLTKGGHYGLTLKAGQIPENVHLAFELSQQQGGSFFDSAGKPTFDTPQNVAAIKQMIGFMQADKIANPSNTQYSKGTEALTDYATGKAAMVFWQTASGSLAKLGMKASDIGVAPLPLPAQCHSGKKVTSMVAGINIAIFKDSKNLATTEKFVKFMTSTTGTGEPQPHLATAAPRSRPRTATRPSTPRPCTPSAASCPRPPRPCPAVALGEPVPDHDQHGDHPPVHQRGHRKAVTNSMIGQALSQAQQQLGG